MPGLSVVHAERVVDCPFSIAADHAAEFLAEVASVGPPLAGVQHRVRLSFGIHSDVAATGGRGHDEIRFAWRAESRWLPDFAGTIRFSIATHDATLLHLEGSYRPPFGLAGRVFDVLVGRRLAAATAADLLERVAVAMESAERAFRVAHPSVG